MNPRAWLELTIDQLRRARAEALWGSGWHACLASPGALEPADLERNVRIRSEPIGVIAAIQRSLSHADHHCGQIVQLARHWSGDAWRSLSIPHGQSQACLAEMRRRFGG